MKAFGDMGNTARLRILRDRFIAGHDSCELRRHLDSMAPETPIRDIVDHCRMWASHADSVDGRGREPRPEWVIPIYMVEDVGEAGDDLPVAAVTASPTASELLGGVASTAVAHTSGVGTGPHSIVAATVGPGPEGSFERAGRAGSWPACIGFLVPELAMWMRQSGWLPPEMDFPTDLFSGSRCPSCAMQGRMEGGCTYIPTGGCMKFFSSDGVVACTLILVWRGWFLDMTVHWPGLACGPDFPKSTGSSGRSKSTGSSDRTLGHCFSGQIDVAGVPGGLRFRFGRILLKPAGMTTLLLLGYVDLSPIGLRPRCFFYSGSLTWTVVWLLFICQYIFALLLMVLLTDSRGIPLTTVSCWAPPRNMRGLVHVSYVPAGPGWCTVYKPCVRMVYCIS